MAVTATIAAVTASLTAATGNPTVTDTTHRQTIARRPDREREGAGRVDRSTSARDRFGAFLRRCSCGGPFRYHSASRWSRDTVRASTRRSPDRRSPIGSRSRPRGESRFRTRRRVRRFRSTAGRSRSEAGSWLPSHPHVRRIPAYKSESVVPPFEPFLAGRCDDLALYRHSGFESVHERSKIGLGFSDRYGASKFKREFRPPLRQ